MVLKSKKTRHDKKSNKVKNVEACDAEGPPVGPSRGTVLRLSAGDAKIVDTFGSRGFRRPLMSDSCQRLDAEYEEFGDRGDAASLPALSDFGRDAATVDAKLVSLLRSGALEPTARLTVFAVRSQCFDTCRELVKSLAAASADVAFLLKEIPGEVFFDVAKMSPSAHSGLGEAVAERLNVSEIASCLREALRLLRLLNEVTERSFAGGAFSSLPTLEQIAAFVAVLVDAVTRVRDKADAAEKQGLAKLLAETVDLCDEGLSDQFAAQRAQGQVHAMLAIDPKNFEVANAQSSSRLIGRQLVHI